MKTKLNLRVEIIVGHSFDKHGRKIDGNTAGVWLDEARKYLASKFSGYTETAATGGYIENGNWVSDESAVFVLYTNAPTPCIHAAAEYLRDLFQQSCVVCSIQLTNAKLI